MRSPAWEETPQHALFWLFCRSLTCGRHPCSTARWIRFIRVRNDGHMLWGKSSSDLAALPLVVDSVVCKYWVKSSSEPSAYGLRWYSPHPAVLSKHKEAHSTLGHWCFSAPSLPPGYPDHMVFSEFRRRFDVLTPHLTKKHGRHYIVTDEKRVSGSVSLISQSADVCCRAVTADDGKTTQLRKCILFFKAFRTFRKWNYSF